MINKPQIAVLDYESATNKQKILDIVQFTIESGPRLDTVRFSNNIARDRWLWGEIVATPFRIILYESRFNNKTRHFYHFHPSTDAVLRFTANEYKLGVYIHR